jgi:hypothetical protein
VLALKVAQIVTVAVRENVTGGGIGGQLFCRHRILKLMFADSAPRLPEAASVSTLTKVRAQLQRKTRKGRRSALISPSVQMMRVLARYEVSL